MQLDELRGALSALEQGGRAGSLESETLDFKRDPQTVVDAPGGGNPRSKLVEEIVSAVVCFANAKGGVVALGIDDKADGRLAFVGTSTDVDDLRRRIFGNTRPGLTVSIVELHHADVRLLAILVPEGTDLVTDSRGRATRRTGTECHPLTEPARQTIVHERRNPDVTARRSAMSPDAVEGRALNAARDLLRRRTDLSSELAALSDRELLRALNVMDRDGHLLIAGEILFCTPRHDVVDILVRSASGEEPGVVRLREPLVSLLPSVVERVSRSLYPETGRALLASGQEIALPDFSRQAVDEAVANALIHREYAIPERTVIDHSPTAFRVWSPGGLPYGVTTDRLLSTISTPRNPTLMGAMQHLGLAERASRGIDRMFKEQLRAGQAPPVFTAGDFSFEVALTSGAPNRAFAGYVASLPATLRDNTDAVLVLAYLCAHPTLTQTSAGSLLQVDPGEAAHRLEALCTGIDPIVQRDGTPRAGCRWRLTSVTAAGLGTAVTHRARSSSARPRIEAHLKEYGWITNRTVRNMFDVDTQQARQILGDLRAEGVLEKDPTGPQRGPGIKWFPARVKR